VTRALLKPHDLGRSFKPVRLPAHLAPITVRVARPARPLTREQAARVVGVHPRTLDRWARLGWLRTIDLGGTVRIPSAETHRRLRRRTA
jgi:excisionase family DNA binding protein